MMNSLIYQFVVLNSTTEKSDFSKKSDFFWISFGIKAKDELVPDVCVYTEPLPAPDEEVDDDLITVSQMPDLAIEILSPTQSVGVRKIKVI
ncbi:MAG: hypothetical protein DRR08_03135 [Candidatus Parabeggiatoa sp. nov. 2]|nr:MAG: hypothetical protein DRR08_03135 [Gammaproteobacteria bacterium]